MRTYTQILIEAPEAIREILQAELFDFGFTSFLETDTGFEVSCETGKLPLADLESLLADYPEVKFSFSEEEERNWNAEWEAHFQPLVVEDKVGLRADFHAPLQTPIELIITPKMSFGTGHHETTRLMIRLMLALDFSGKKVADLGCGTGVLGILALKLGAETALGCDIDPWALENTPENAEKNEVNFPIYAGTVNHIPEGQFDVLLANINRGVLLEEIPHYAERLTAGGHLLLSGFRPDDVSLIEEKAQGAGLSPLQKLQEGNWIGWAWEK